MTRTTRIPEIDPATLTQVVRFRSTSELRKTVRHIAVDEGASEQNTYIHLLKLGLDEFAKESQPSGSVKSRRAS